jgi:putative salt-induced outer membrane protein
MGVPGLFPGPFVARISAEAFPRFQFDLRRESMMKRHILIVLILVVLTVCGRAGDTNQTVAMPTNKPAENISNGLAVAAAVGSAIDATHSAVVATNKSAWESSIAFGLTLTSGNSDTLLANTTFNTHRRNPTNEWFFGAEAAYGENNTVKNAETLHGFGQYNHLFSERWFGYLRTDGLHDGIADVVYRVTLSPGVGYYFIKTKATTFAGEVGPSVVLEKLDGERSIYLTPRFAEHFEHKMDDHTRFWENVEFLPEADNPDNFLINAEMGVEAALTRRLSLRTVIQDSYANIPAPGRKDNDLKLISGLAYKF